MSSFFTLELDTTPPAISIECPQRAGVEDIYIKVNLTDDVDEYDISITDSAGVIYRPEFLRHPGYAEKRINFSAANKGVARVLARASDDVGNTSEVTQMIVVSSSNGRVGVAFHKETLTEEKIADLLSKLPPPKKKPSVRFLDKNDRI